MNAPIAFDLVLALTCITLACTSVVLYKRTAALRRRARRVDTVLPSQLARFIRRTYTHIARGDANARGHPDANAIVFRSEWGEDAFLYDLFEGKQTGVYVEAGAFDGVYNSATFAFEAIGWTGLLVEPIPAHAKACQAARPRSHVLHAALDEAATDATATFMVPATFEHQLSAHRSGLASGHVDHELKRANASLREVDVPLVTLTKALDDASIEQIDFIVLDVEGLEVQALRGFELGRFKPRALIIEDHSMGADGSLARELSPAGYASVGFLGHNQVFIRQDDPALITRARECMLSHPFATPSAP